MFRFPSSRRLSCGTVILHPGREILLCHVTGQSHWDLPKGGIDPGETPLDAALRETREETGLVLDRETLVDLGQRRYTAKKDLHLYATCVPHFELAPLHCTTLFVERQHGRSLPEMDGYAWFGFDRIEAACTPTMGRLLTRELDLDRWVRTIRPAATPPRVLPRG